ncbi:MAG: GIY-YIG nuclease family protein [Bacteroidaceae bacterium]|nr:GIY-YIG nuclease family protein [Bacteroidaceae bacterium]
MVNIHQYWVYIMSNKSRTVLYIGMTNDLYRRYLEHKQEVIKGFTQKYKCHDLLYYEEFADVNEAIAREKHLKGWIRAKKDELIATINPDKKDLAVELGWL